MSGATARHAGTALLWIAVVALTYSGLSHPFGNGDEVRHAQTLREMMATGDWLTMRWEGVPSYTRPATQYWLAALGAWLVDGEVGMRLSSATASLATLVMVWLLALRYWGDRSAAALGVLLCAGAASFHGYSRSLLTDPLLVVALLAALGSTMRAREEPAAIAWGLGSLGAAVGIKSLAAGPPALLLLPWLWHAQRRHGTWRPVVTGLAVAAVLGLPFYIIGFALHGEAFWSGHFGFNLVGRATGDINVSGYPWTLYFDHIRFRDGLPTLAWMGLGTLGALIAGVRLRDHQLTVVGVFGVGILVLMSALGTRLPHYILVAYPAAAIGIAGMCAHALRRWPPRRELYRTFVPALGVALALNGLSHTGSDVMLMQTPAGRDLGRAARAIAAPGQPIYAHEWYGMAVGFYAQRPIKLSTAHQDRFRQVDVGHLHRARTAVLVPPAPEPVGSRILVVGRRKDLETATWMRVEEPLAASPPYFLVRAVIVAPQP